MGWGVLTPGQEKALKPFIRGKGIVDLGAGDLSLSKELIRLGAKTVAAYDKDGIPAGYSQDLPKGLTFKKAHFHEISMRPFPVLFVSWPVNQPNPSLTVHASFCEEMLIYLGKNDRGTSCGHPNLFKVMVQRELLAYVPGKKNDLIVTGKFLPQGQTREATPEEHRGLIMLDFARSLEARFPQWHKSHAKT